MLSNKGNFWFSRKHKRMLLTLSFLFFLYVLVTEFCQGLVSFLPSEEKTCLFILVFIWLYFDFVMYLLKKEIEFWMYLLPSHVTCLLIDASASQPAIIALLFFKFQRNWIVLRRCLFLRSFHTFSWFLEPNWSSDFGHAETGSGAEKRVVLRREIICSNIKVEWEYGVWTNIRFLASDFLFTCGNFTLNFNVYFEFLTRIYSKWCFQSIHISF